MPRAFPNGMLGMLPNIIQIVNCPREGNYFFFRPNPSLGLRGQKIVAMDDEREV